MPPEPVQRIALCRYEDKSRANAFPVEHCSRCKKPRGNPLSAARYARLDPKGRGDAGESNPDDREQRLAELEAGRKMLRPKRADPLKPDFVWHS